MLLNSTAIVGDTLNIAYAQWNYPYLYRQIKVVGFLADVWKTFGFKIVYHQYPYESDSGSDTCDGILQSALDGSTITSAGGSSPSVRRSRLFRMSLPVYYTSFQFFESSRSDEEESTAFSFFAVFSVPALILLIAAFAVISILNYAIQNLRSRNEHTRNSRNWAFCVVRELTNVVCLIAITIVIYYHAAGFKGNNVMSIPPKTTSFTELQDGLQSGKRQLITQSNTTIAAVKIAVLTRNRTTLPDLVEPDHNSLLKKMCDNPKLITMLERYTVQGPTMVDRPCELRRVGVPSDNPNLYNFDRTVMQNFMFSREHTDARTVEKVNLALLRFFNQDLIETFWTQRYSKTRKVFNNAPHAGISIDEEYRVMSLRRLAPLFYTTLPGWVGSIVLFFIELLSSTVRKLFTVRLSMLAVK